MRLVSFVREGVSGFGVFIDGRIFDMTDLDADCVDLRSTIDRNALAGLADAAVRRGVAFAPDDVTFRPVIPNPDKILCVGLNYHSHRLETGRPESAHPAIFVRFADSQTGHGCPVPRPRVSGALDFEGELAVVIGRGGRYIAAAEAMRHVAGYACYNDITVRDFQRHTHQFTPGKNFPATGAFGPWLVTPDDVGDITSLGLTTRLNGEVMQQASFRDLIFPIPEIIAYVSSFTALSPGDVIATGTPGGVGFKRTPPVYMKAGDVIEVEIPSIGHLSNTIEDE